MKVTQLALVPAALVVLALTACPQRKEAIDKVGGAAKGQVDEAHKRIDKAADKMNANAAAAAATE